MDDHLLGRPAGVSLPAAEVPVGGEVVFDLGASVEAGFHGRIEAESGSDAQATDQVTAWLLFDVADVPDACGTQYFAGVPGMEVGFLMVAPPAQPFTISM